MDFKLTSKYSPTGDQPEAIKQLTEELQQGAPAQVLLGVTGSGKTFTVANVIANVNKPTLILSHNKTLAAQLCAEFREFGVDFGRNGLCVLQIVHRGEIHRGDAMLGVMVDDPLQCFGE